MKDLINVPTLFPKSTNGILPACPGELFGAKNGRTSSRPSFRFSGTDGHTSVSGRRFAEFRARLHLAPRRYLNNRVPSSLRSTAASRREIFLADR
jgi:hypothetical protein